MTRVLKYPYRLFAALAVAAVLCGCKAPAITQTVPDLSRGYRPHMEQVMDNIAAFTLDPGTWPSHVLIFKGFFETRNQWLGSAGTSTRLENTTYGTTHWDLAYLDDPYDVRRVRLLYQWQVGHITFEQLEQRWQDIRDLPVFDSGGKPVLGSDGRPSFIPLPLPVHPDTKRDWITDRPEGATTGLSGRAGTLLVPGMPAKTVKVVDSEGATQFSLAILSAMANTRVKARWSDAVMTTP